MTPILAMLAAVSLVQTFNIINSQEFTRKFVTTDPVEWAERLFAGSTTKILFVFFLTHWVFSANAIPIYITWGTTLTPSDIETFEWIKVNIPTNSHFGLITGKKPLTDPISEWFPTLTNMVSVNTPQGHEWLPEFDFNQILIASSELQDCARQDIRCIKTWESSNNQYMEYLYIRKTDINSRGVPYLIMSPVEMSAVASGDYRLIYTTDEVSILQKR